MHRETIETVGRVVCRSGNIRARSKCRLAKIVMFIAISTLYASTNASASDEWVAIHDARIDYPPVKHDPEILAIDKQGHFRNGKGNRIKLFGVNLTFGQVFQEKEKLASMVEQLSSNGINTVRIHNFDGPPKRNGIFNEDLVSLNAANLDKFDYLVSRLHLAGIHIIVTLNSVRKFNSSDHNLPYVYRHWKKLSRFDEELVDKQNVFIKNLFGRKNKYLKKNYSEDQIILSVELTNENMITGLNERQVSKMPEPYKSEFQGLYLKWSEQVKKSQYGVVSLTNFERALDQKYFDELKSTVEKILGTKTYVIDTQAKMGGGYGLIHSIANDDYTSTHGYWDHPAFGSSKNKNEFTINNQSVVLRNDPLHFLKILSYKIAGKPFVVSEYNHPYPNKYRSEMMLLAFDLITVQDVDGFLFFDYKDNRDSDVFESYFNIKQNPATMEFVRLLSRYLHSNVEHANHMNFEIDSVELENIQRQSRDSLSKVISDACNLKSLVDILNIDMDVVVGGTTKCNAVKNNTANKANVKIDYVSGSHIVMETDELVLASGYITEDIRTTTLNIHRGHKFDNWLTLAIYPLDPGVTLKNARDIGYIVIPEVKNTGFAMNNDETRVLVEGRAPKLMKTFQLDISLDDDEIGNKTLFHISNSDGTYSGIMRK